MLFNWTFLDFKILSKSFFIRMETFTRAKGYLVESDSEDDDASSLFACNLPVSLYLFLFVKSKLLNLLQSHIHKSQNIL